MDKLQTRTIAFREVTSVYPTPHEVKQGVYALHKVTGNYIKIDPNKYSISSREYSFYALATSFPSASKYDEKYNDLVKAKDILKADRWDAEGVGQAIGLIKRFLDKTAKL